MRSFFILLISFCIFPVCLPLKCSYGVKWKYFDIRSTCEGQVCVSGTAYYQNVQGIFWGCLTENEAIDAKLGCNGLNECNLISERTVKGYQVKKVNGCCCNIGDRCNKIPKQKITQKQNYDGMGGKILDGLANVGASIYDLFG